MKNPVTYSKLAPLPILLHLSGLFRRKLPSLIARLYRRRSHQRDLHAIEHLARAMEYLEDTRPFGAEATPRAVAIEQSLVLLKACHRNAFFACSSEGQLRAARAFR